MNERIRELAKQALFESDFDDEQNIYITMEMFAELIVRECAQVCRSQTNDSALKLDRENCAFAIEEHFGVE